MSYLKKRKFRQGAGIGLSELKNNREKDKELTTELLMNKGYVGYFDDNETTGLRVYVFQGRDSLELFLREAHKIGLRTAGEIDGPLHISNAELNRPHLKYFKGRKNWYSELYK